MKSIKIILVFNFVILLSVSKLLCQTAWQNTYNTISGSGQVIQTSDGGFASVGNVTVAPTAGVADIVFTKYDAAGSVQWSKIFGGTGTELGTHLVEAPDGNYYIAGRSLSFGAGSLNTIIMKTDASGNLLWSRHVPNSGFASSTPFSIATNTLSEVIVVGNSISSTGVVYGNLAHLSGTGTVVQGREFFFNNTSSYQHIGQQTSDGGYIICSGSNVTGGPMLFKYTSTMVSSWRISLPGVGSPWIMNSVQQASDGNYVVCGQIGFGSGANDGFLMKIDASGNFMWGSAYGDALANNFRHFRQTSDGGFIAVGNTNNGTNTDVFLVKTTSAGAIEWSKKYDLGGNEDAYSVFQTTNGGYIIGASNSAGNTYIIRTDVNGDAGNCNANKFNIGRVSFSPPFPGNPAHQVTASSYNSPLASDNPRSVTTTTLCSASFCNVNATFTSGTTNIAAGNPISFTNSSTNASTYTWKDGVSVIGTSSNLTYTFFASGTSTITLIASNGSCSDTVTQLINVTPIITGANWQKMFSTISGNCQSIQTQDGGYASVSSVNPPNTAGNTDIVLSKYDANGNIQWAKLFGGSNVDIGSFIAQAADGNFYLAGTSQSFVSSVAYTYIIKADINGNLIWSRLFALNNTSPPFSIQTTTANGVVVCGQYQPSFQIDGTLIHLDQNGNTLQMRYLASASGNVHYGVGQQTSDGGYIHASHFNSGTNMIVVKYTSAMTPTWSRTYDGPAIDSLRSVQQTADGGYLVAGHTTSFGQGSHDGFMMKLDASGNISWYRAYGDANYNSFHQARQTSDGGYIAVGKTFNGANTDIMVIKTSSTGIVNWSKSYDYLGNEEGYSASQTSDGGYIISGKNGSGFLTILKTDANGNAGTCNTGTFSPIGFSYSPSSGAISLSTSNSNLVNPIPAQNSANITPTISCFQVICTAPVQPTTINGPTTICQGSIATYSVALVSGATSYSWTLPGGWSGSSSTNSINLTSGSTGTLAVIATNSCGTSPSQTLNITVNSIPSANAGASATITCTTPFVNLNGSGVTTYTWSGPGIVSGGNTSSPVVNIAGTYSLVGSMSGCNSNTTTVIVSTNTIAPSVSVTATSNSICIGNSATLTASGASTYSWSTSSTATSIVVSPTTTTNYILTGTNTVNGCTNTINKSIGVNPLPVVTANTSNSIICGPPFQGTATITASGASTYTWNTAATTTAIAISPSITTVYTVTGTDSNGCMNSTSFTQSVSACTSVQQSEVGSSEFGVYPNPTSGVVTIKAKAGLQIIVYNIIGELILTTELKTDTVEINLNAQANGIYFIKVGSVTRKIIKE